MIMTTFNEAAFVLEWDIIKDKLNQGLNGVEWLVLNYESNQATQSGLDGWIKGLGVYGHKNFDEVMLFTLTSDADSFYEMYGFNWWMSVNYTLEYLHTLRIEDYDSYFTLLQKLDNKGRM
ncbi:hypothetical protein [Paenibacillus polymyxa]|uniref:hypothetical protein n=1 Tax=Paenibacillus polymyxa TaxID=1406 RepID=UPI00040A248D|nr:hypothetical protein [Paenibacillus polymyxa]